MPELEVQSYTVPAGAEEAPRLLDLAIRDTDAGPVLYATSAFSGALSTWQLGAGSPDLLSRVAHVRGDAAGVRPDLGFIIDGAGQVAVLTGGGATGELAIFALGVGGAITGVEVLGRVPRFAGDLSHTVTIEQNGTQFVYGGLSGQAGLGRLRVFDGVIVGRAVIDDTAQTSADNVAGLASATVDGVPYLFSAGADDPGLTAWRVAGNGGLTVAATLTTEDGLWIGTPSAVATARQDGRVFAIVAAAGSNSLSVVAVEAGGAMRVIDHVLDDRVSRFADVTALDVVQHAGQTWVVAGGSDDGISLFRMLPDGRLLSESHLADTPQSGLSNISALAAHSTGPTLEIIAASADEPGLTQIVYDTGPAGRRARAADSGQMLVGTGRADVLSGGDGPDRLRGERGDDVLLDGAGSDVLIGGAGADTFVLTGDGRSDIITDFTPGQDRIDLSGWALLRDVSQLDMAQTANGFTIAYGDEVLTVRSANGRGIDPAMLPAQDLIATPRLQPQLFIDPDRRPTGDDLTGTPASDRLQADDGGQRVFGLAGHDTLLGGMGRDWLFGGRGRDLLDGGGGANRLLGGLGDDTYIVRSATDRITGETGYSVGGGVDQVRSWISYSLPRNVEILRLQGDADIHGYGNGAPEVLVGNAGSNTLSGGWGTDRLVAKGGDDVLIGGALSDELVGNGGRDTFVYTAVSDSRAGQGNRDFINGFEHYIDRIDLSQIDANSLTAGTNDAFRFLGARREFTGAPGELIYATYGQNWVIVSADTNGDRIADFQIFINQTDWMTGADFLL